MYSDFRKFIIKEQAEAFAKILQDNDVNVVLKEVKPNVDITFSNNQSMNYWIRVPEDQVVQAESILSDDNNSISMLQEHYFFEFTNEELIEVLESYYDWNKTDYQYARLILKERGLVYSDEDIELFKEKSIEEQRQPEKGKTSWIIAGFITAFMRGLLGVILGWSYWTDFKKLPNGEKVHRFDRSTRQKGKTMMIIGLIVMVLAIVIRVVF